MKTATSVKGGAAFLAGVVVALGGAFIYFKTTEPHLRSAIQVSAVEDGGSSAPDLSTQPQMPPAATDSRQTPQAQAQAKAETAPKQPAKSKPVFSQPRTTSRPVSLAVWHPKNQPKQELVVQDLPAQPVVPAAESPAPQVTQPIPPPAQPPPVQPHTVTIPAGTSVAIRLNEKLSTDHNYGGDTFRATLDTPIIMDGFIIADKGAKVLGKIVRAQKPGRFEGMAELSLTLTEIATTDGQLMHVETNESLRKGPSNTNEEVLKMGGGAALGAIIGAIAGGGKGAAMGAGAGGAAGTGAVLLGHGKPAVIENETRLTFAFASPVTITEQLK